MTRDAPLDVGFSLGKADPVKPRGERLPGKELVGHLDKSGVFALVEGVLPELRGVVAVDAGAAIERVGHGEAASVAVEFQLDMESQARKLAEMSRLSGSWDEQLRRIAPMKHFTLPITGLRPAR